MKGWQHLVRRNFPPDDPKTPAVLREALEENDEEKALAWAFERLREFHESARRT
jgi:hypothetical protein